MGTDESSFQSPVYFALVDMIEKAWIAMGLVEIEEHFESLQKKGLITADECQSVLQLAMNKMKNPDLSKS